MVFNVELEKLRTALKVLVMLSDSVLPLEKLRDAKLTMVSTLPATSQVCNKQASLFHALLSSSPLSAVPRNRIVNVTEALLV